MCLVVSSQKEKKKKDQDLELVPFFGGGQIINKFHTIPDKTRFLSDIVKKQGKKAELRIDSAMYFEVTLTLLGFVCFTCDTEKIIFDDGLLMINYSNAGTHLIGFKLVVLPGQPRRLA